MKKSTLEQINEARHARRAIAVVTEIGADHQHLVTNADGLNPELSEAVSKRLKSGKSGVEIIAEKENFVQVHVPSPRLVVIGAVHISQALVPMAQACGFDVIVIDPRTGFASTERFEGVNIHAEWPENVLKDNPLDVHTALIAVTHDPKIDDLPLQEALKTGCFYVGALGSRKTHAKRIDRLSAAGFGKEALGKIHAPIGLDIGAASRSEIAVAILAQMIAVLRKGATV